MQIVLNDISPESDVVVRPDPLMSDDEYYQFCLANPSLRLERTATGEIEIMPPTGDETSGRNSEVNMQLRTWAKRDGRGKVFDSNAEFILPNGAGRSPDACWIEKSRWKALTNQQRRAFAPLCPDFVVEIRSPSDRLGRLQAKLQEYMENGAQLGWLIDPDSRAVYIYRPAREVERLIGPGTLSGEAPIDGFVLDLNEVWDTDD